jgi:hypothetical protein
MPAVMSAPKYLIPQRIERADGVGPAIDLEELRRKFLVVTLKINEVLEQEGLTVVLWGSATGSDWGGRPLLSFPQKSYCGEYATLLDLEQRPDIRFLRVEWKMNRWAHRDSGLRFGFEVSLQDSLSHVSSAVA